MNPDTITIIKNLCVVLTIDYNELSYEQISYIKLLLDLYSSKGRCDALEGVNKKLNSI